MNRNSELHFSTTPKVDIPRSTFPMEFNHKTSFNVGQLVPLAIFEVLPGDTWQANQHLVARLSTLINPVMDNLYLDTYAFYSANRTLWTHWKELQGENRQGAWAQTTEYEVPTLTTPTGGANAKTLMDYMGIPTGVAGLEFSALPIRAYVKIWNEFFRDQNVTAPITEYDDDTDRTASNTLTELGGAVLNSYKFHDYFTSALPAPQKGDPVTLPIGQSAPVVGTEQGLYMVGIDANNNRKGGYLVSDFDYQPFSEDPIKKHTIKFIPDTDATKNIGTQINITGQETNMPVNNTIIGTAKRTNLITDLTNAVAATINAQRYAFALQRILESDARGGTRYREILKNIFHVVSPDATQQVPEYLGGKRIPLNIAQVEQTSKTDTTGTPLGNVAGMSTTGDSDRMFTKSFTEHGYIIVLATVRQNHTYAQGINRMWNHLKRFHFYMPQLAFLGEQEIKNKELFAQDQTSKNPSTQTPYNEEIFGYQERWAEYRYTPSMVTAEMRPQYAQTLASWHFADYYNSLPTLSTEFLQETADFVDRTLAVSKSTSNQVILDYLLDIKATRPIPMYSIPGLLDHF